MSRCSCAPIAALVALVALAPAARAQSTTPPAAAQPTQATTGFPADSLPAFVRAHLAVTHLRDVAQAELAEPKNKKPEEQARIRTKLHDDVVASLRAQGFTPARFDDVTRLVSLDGDLRKAFEDELLRQGAAKP